MSLSMESLESFQSISLSDMTEGSDDVYGSVAKKPQRRHLGIQHPLPHRHHRTPDLGPLRPTEEASDAIALTDFSLHHIRVVRQSAVYVRQSLRRGFHTPDLPPSGGMELSLFKLGPARVPPRLMTTSWSTADLSLEHEPAIHCFEVDQADSGVGSSWDDESLFLTWINNPGAPLCTCAAELRQAAKQRPAWRTFLHVIANSSSHKDLLQIARPPLTAQSEEKSSSDLGTPPGGLITLGDSPEPSPELIPLSQSHGSSSLCLPTMVEGSPGQQHKLGTTMTMRRSGSLECLASAGAGGRG